MNIGKFFISFYKIDIEKKILLSELSNNMNNRLTYMHFNFTRIENGRRNENLAKLESNGRVRTA